MEIHVELLISGDFCSPGHIIQARLRAQMLPTSWGGSSSYLMTSWIEDGGVGWGRSFHSSTGLETGSTSASNLLRPVAGPHHLPPCPTCVPLLLTCQWL